MLHQLNTYFSKVDLRFIRQGNNLIWRKFCLPFWSWSMKTIWIFDHYLEVETIVTHVLFVPFFFGYSWCVDPPVCVPYVIV